MLSGYYAIELATDSSTIDSAPSASRYRSGPQDVDGSKSRGGDAIDAHAIHSRCRTAARTQASQPRHGQRHPYDHLTDGSPDKDRT